MYNPRCASAARCNITPPPDLVQLSTSRIHFAKSHEAQTCLFTHTAAMRCGRVAPAPVQTHGQFGRKDLGNK